MYLRFFNLYAGFAGFLSRCCLAMAYFLLAAMTLLSFVAVVYRYVLNAPILWSEELARYLLIWMVLFAASVAVKDRKHVNLSFILVRLPYRLALIIEIVSYAMIVFISGMILKYGAVVFLTHSMRALSPSLQVSMAWAHAAIPVGFALILVQSLYIMLEDIVFYIQGIPLKNKISEKI